MEQEREYRRLKELQTSLQKPAPVVNLNGPGHLITAKDFAFFAEKHPNLASKLPFYSAMLGISVRITIHSS